MGREYTSLAVKRSRFIVRSKGISSVVKEYRFSLSEYISSVAKEYRFSVGKGG